MSQKGKRNIYNFEIARKTCPVILVLPLARLMKDLRTSLQNAAEGKRKIYNFEILHGHILLVGSGRQNYIFLILIYHVPLACYTIDELTRSPADKCIGGKPCDFVLRLIEVGRKVSVSAVRE